MLPHQNLSWRDPDAPWNVKLRQAERHIGYLARQIADFRSSAPYTLTPETTEAPGRFAYRVRRRPIPVEFSAIVGDVLNNLRAALESASYEIARRGQGGSLLPEQESAPAFPICVTPKRFEEFFTRSHRGVLYDQQARDSLRTVQPFALAEKASAGGSDPGGSYEEDAKYDPLYRLNTLWNIDKHRRLTLMIWRLKFVYWFGSAEQERHFDLGDSELEDGAVAFELDANDAGEAIDVKYEFSLVLADDPLCIGNPMADDDIVDLLKSWHWYIAGWALPNVFFVPAAPVA